MGNISITKIEKQIQEKTSSFTEYLFLMEKEIKKITPKFEINEEKTINFYNFYKEPTQIEESLYILLERYNNIIKISNDTISISNKVWKKLFDRIKNKMDEIIKNYKIIAKIESSSFHEFKNYYLEYVKKEIPNIIENQQYPMFVNYLYTENYDKNDYDDKICKTEENKRENIFKAKDVLKYIIFIYENFQQDYNNIETIISLSKYLYYKDIKNGDQFKETFFNYNFPIKLSEKYEEFISNFLIQINDFESFKKNQNYILKRKENIIKILCIFVCLFHYNTLENKINELFDEIQIFDDRLLIINIFIELMNKNDKESIYNNYITDYIINKYLNFFKDKYKCILYISEFLNNKDFLKIFNGIIHDLTKSQFYNQIKYEKIDNMKIIIYIKIFWNTFNNNDEDKKSLISLISKINYKKINDNEFKNKFYNLKFNVEKLL